MADKIHYQKSTLREKIVEHAFVGDALRELWRSRIVDVEILRSEFDAFGYDLVVERGRVTRHVQLKAGLRAPDGIGIAEALANKKSGCLIYIQISDGLDLEHFYWFGAGPAEALPSVGRYPLLKRTRPNKAGIKAERSDYRSLPKAAFEGPYSLRQILTKLLGA